MALDTTIDLSQVRTELGAYLRTHNTVVAATVYARRQLSAFAKRITKVKGVYPSFHSVVGNVVQGFIAEWTPMGATKIKPNNNVSYHQKVNFPIRPHDLINSYIADLHESRKTPAQQPFAKWLIDNEVLPKVNEDLAILEIDAVYDDTKLQEFGFSMNGIEKILTDGLASVTKPMYKVPLAALTEVNMLEQVTRFEKSIPQKVSRKIKQIFMSTKNLQNFILDHENTLGIMPSKSKNDFTKTRLNGWEIVGLDFLTSDRIFTFLPGNLLELVDLENPPAITDLQVQDYDIKVFMEFWDGLGFYINHGVFCSVLEGEGVVAGLGSAELNDLYYPKQVQ